MSSCWTSSASSSSYARLFLKMCLTVICLLLILLDGANGNGFGSCPKYPLMEDFDFSKLEGEWYEIEKSTKFLESLNGCVRLQFKTKDLYTFSLKLEILSTKTRYISLYVGEVVPETTSILNFLIDNDYGGQYHVLGTDYENFVILWSCYSWGWFAYFDKIWVIGKRSNLPPEFFQQINCILNKFGLDSNRLVLSNSLCPY